MPPTLDAPTAPVPRAKLARKPFWIGVLVGALAMAALLTAVRLVNTTAIGANAYLVKNRYADGVVQTPSGLQYKVIKPGKGARPTDSDVALITYTGTLTDGTVFDKSQQPVPMPVAGVVPGFSEALKLMPKGAEYRVWIKPELGYGSQPTGPIPANSVLVFDIQLLDFLPETVVRQLQSQAAGATPAPQPGAQPKR